jgi:protocatechuate 3,4-dioxygenase beta subunit
MTHDDELHDHDRGLSHDLPMLSRRRTLTLFGGAGLAAALASCGIGSTDQSEAADSPSPSGTSGAGSTGAESETVTSSTGTEIPEETAGPYPGDRSNGVNVLTETGIVRSDITTSFGSASAIAVGVPLTITLSVLDVSSGSGPLAGAAVYLWHCDINGKYSLYSDGITQENYLRGVQETGSDGSVRFTSIFPAAYSGRWPHIHFEVYPSLEAATTASGRLRTSQLALPEDACALVYATDGYEQSVRNMAQTSLDTDNVFSDGYSLQLATVTGDVDTGMAATLNVPV